MSVCTSCVCEPKRENENKMINYQMGAADNGSKQPKGAKGAKGNERDEGEVTKVGRGITWLEREQGLGRETMNKIVHFMIKGWGE